MSKEIALTVVDNQTNRMMQKSDKEKKHACEEAAVENDKENDAEEVWQRTPDQAQEAD